MAEATKASDIMKTLAQWRQSSPNGKIKANVVVAGLVGSGKSALVNALFGEQVAKEAQSPKLKKKAEVHTLNYNSSAIAIWDTHGFMNSADQEAFEAIKKVPCIKGSEEFTLLYTIAINKKCCGIDCDNCSNLQCMMNLKAYWKNSIIVFTFANCNLSEAHDEEVKKVEHLENLKEWESAIRRHLQSKIVDSSTATKIPIIPVGYINPETETLDFGSKGNSWILDTWQGITEAAPLQDKPLLLDICVNKFYSAGFVYCDSYLSLIKIYIKAYKEKVCSDVSSAYAFLHLLLFWLNNKQVKRLTPCKKGNLQYWTSLVGSVEVIVTGGKDSGKTSIINSMLLCSLNERNIQIPARFRNVSCTLVETPLASLSPDPQKKSALVILCLLFNDSVANMKKILQILPEIMYQNILIVLTNANTNGTDMSVNEVVKRQTLQINKILKEISVTKKNLKIVPAGYHTEMRITPDDPLDQNWVINVWLAAISQAEANSQPGMIIPFNYCALHRKLFPVENYEDCKATYIKGITEVLMEIAMTHDILQKD